MKKLIYLFLFLLFWLTTQGAIDCEDQKLHAVYYATRCCYVTLAENDLEFVKCHAKYSNMADRPPNNRTAPERIAINICAHECSLIEKDFIKADDKGVIDADVVEDYYLNKYPNKPVFSTYMMDTFKKCEKFDSVGEVNIKYPNVTFLQNITCDPLAARIMMCVRTKAMQSCPSTAWDSSSFDCGAAKLYFKECVGSIEKVVRNID